MVGMVDVVVLVLDGQQPHHPMTPPPNPQSSPHTTTPTQAAVQVHVDLMDQLGPMGGVGEMDEMGSFEF